MRALPRIVLGILLLAAVVFAGTLLAHRRHAFDTREEPPGNPPREGQHQAATEPVKLYLASDADDSLTTAETMLALPAQPEESARAIVAALLAQQAAPTSNHPLPAGNAIRNVSFVPVDIPAVRFITPQGQTMPQIAIVDLDPAFAAHHPVGMATEMLTVRSLVATLHANFPQVAAVRFLVDGKPANTLAGHADLMHIYSATEEQEMAQDQGAF